MGNYRGSSFPEGTNGGINGLGVYGVAVLIAFPRDEDSFSRLDVFDIELGIFSTLGWLICPSDLDAVIGFDVGDIGAL